MKKIINKAIQQINLKLKDYPKRLKHVYGVAETAKKLALHYHINEDEAFICGLYHDYAKYDEHDYTHLNKEQIDIVKKYPVMYHAYEASYQLQHHLGINNENMIEAITNHVWGRPQMSLLEKIIFVSDMCEPNRNFLDTKIIYNQAIKDIDQAVYMCMKISLKDLEKRHLKPSLQQLKAFEYYKEIISEK